ncbi:DUF1552 domain-containing protein [Lentisphaera marina]|uniref:DUF1552 domain-containing protein n=1 Tax=Lentisphaera marina TaxID=1111041 RepID=UPI002366BE92|nr:DUF1552 domain-containing protein [Lentisphaera marina]MDD7985069.1 DUF1552 domain-containing protein [Lentisphaera marina]
MNRRVILKSLSASILLPSLEAFSSPNSPNNDIKRALWFYLPNGVNPYKWFPSTVGDYEFTPSLSPLKNHKKDVAVLSGLDRIHATGTDVHAQSGCCWLTSSAHHERTDGAYPLNTTLDHVIASSLPRATPFPTLAVNCNEDPNVRETKHFDSVSWYGPGYSAPNYKSPLGLFNSLFRSKANIDSSILDLIMSDAKSLKSKVSGHDGEKLDEYFTSVRELEQESLLLAQKQQELSKVTFPDDEMEPVKRSEYMRLMGKLTVMALKLDLTRNVTFMAGPERWSSPLFFDGVFDKKVVHHSLTHKEDAQDKVAEIDRFYVQQFSYILDELKKSKDHQGKSLFDSTTSVMGSGLGYGFDHRYDRLAVVVAGKNVKGNGQHTAFPKGTPLANLWLNMAQHMGVKKDRYADSTASLQIL